MLKFLERWLSLFGIVLAVGLRAKNPANFEIPQILKVFQGSKIDNERMENEQFSIFTGNAFNRKILNGQLLIDKKML